MTKKKPVTVQLTPTQRSLARRRIFAEDLSWQKVLNALMNAYITGDITVTKNGRYQMAPPQGSIPVIHVPKGGELVEIDVDWGTHDSRPQVGANHKAPKGNRSTLAPTQWGTRELATYLQKETGRLIRSASLRNLLRTIEIPKADGNRWLFEGEKDPFLPEILEAFQDGTYDLLIRQGVYKAEVAKARRKNNEDEFNEATIKTESERKIAHLKRLRSIEKP